MDEGPTIVYNVASRTGQDITPDLVMRLAEHSNFLGMKECSGKERIEQYAKEGIVCWSGNDDEVSHPTHGLSRLPRGHEGGPQADPWPVAM